MTFKQWLMETGTTTGDIAGFSRICMPMVRRTWPNDEKKKKRQPQVKETKQS